MLLQRTQAEEEALDYQTGATSYEKVLETVPPKCAPGRIIKEGKMFKCGACIDCTAKKKAHRRKNKCDKDCKICAEPVHTVVLGEVNSTEKARHSVHTCIVFEVTYQARCPSHL